MNTSELLSRREHVLGRNAPLFYDQPIHIVRGEGVWLYDDAGKQYLDVYNNVPNVGHCHPHVVNALCAQARTLNVHTRYLHETIVEYGERLTGLLDESLSMVFLTCSGSEANELALRMIRHASGGQGVICTNATYHGNTRAVDALATLFRDGKTDSPEVRAVDYPDSYRRIRGRTGPELAEDCLRQVEAAIANFEADGQGFAGALICPIFANEGLPDVPAGFLAELATIVRRGGGYLIFDEVQSAFGRTGHMWGHQISGVTPDVMTLGKPMGNGHPLAGAICTPALGNGFRDHAMYFNTFGGNPVSCAVGMAVLDVIEEEDLITNAANTGAYIHKQLEDMATRYPLIGDVRSQGLFFAVELVTDHASQAPAAAEARTLVNKMKERGVLMSKIGMHDNILKMRPPLCFSRENADQLLSTLDTVLGELH